MTDLRDRLDLLAREATEGLFIESPASGGQPAQWPRVLVLAVVLLAAGAATAFVVTRDGSADVVVDVPDQPAGRPAILDRAGTAADALPEYVSDLGLEVDVDLDGLRSGPSAAGYRVYLAPTVDGLGYCALIAPTTLERYDDGGAVGTSCSTFSALARKGFSVSSTRGQGWSFTYGVTTSDVVGVAVLGEEAAFDDGVFLISGVTIALSTDLVDEIELTRVP